MTIRKNNTSDMQTVIVALLKSLQTSEPWDSWEIIAGYPNEDQISAADKSIVYVETPLLIGPQTEQFGGGEPKNEWVCIIGYWNSIDEGGQEEAGVWNANMITLIQTKGSLYNYQFNVEIGGVTFSNTTLGAQGVWLQDISPPRPIDSPEEDRDDYRIEVDISITA